MGAAIGMNKIISSREFEFPRELVFQAWTNPERPACRDVVGTSEHMYSFD